MLEVVPEFHCCSLLASGMTGDVLFLRRVAANWLRRFQFENEHRANPGASSSSSSSSSLSSSSSERSQLVRFCTVCRFSIDFDQFSCRQTEMIGSRSCTASTRTRSSSTSHGRLVAHNRCRRSSRVRWCQPGAPAGPGSSDSPRARRLVTACLPTSSPPL